MTSLKGRLQLWTSAPTTATTTAATTGATTAPAIATTTAASCGLWLLRQRVHRPSPGEGRAPAPAGAEEEVRAAEAGEAEQIPGRQLLRQEPGRHHRRVT